MEKKMNAQFVTSFPSQGYRIFLVTTDDNKGYIVTAEYPEGKPAYLVAPCPCCMNQNNRDAIENAAKAALANGVTEVFWGGQWSYEWEERGIHSINHYSHEDSDPIGRYFIDEEVTKLVISLTEPLIAAEIAEENRQKKAMEDAKINRAIQKLVGERRYADARVLCELHDQNLSNFVEL
jgi:hypothetical protein